MIKLHVQEPKPEGVAHQFHVQANEPVTITFTQHADGSVIAYAYKGDTVDEFSEPVGAYDSNVEPTSWEEN